MECIRCGSEFSISHFESSLREKLSPTPAKDKLLLPPPKECPTCRQQRRLSFRNERHLYRRTCDLTKKPIISMYPANSPFKVFERNAWFSDDWDPLLLGQDYDSSRPFLDQLLELFYKVPRVALIQQGIIENSDYCNRASNVKNCYLVFSTSSSEDCYYCINTNDSRNCVDCSNVQRSELCYECQDCFHCYGLKYCDDCTNCHSSSFLKYCTGCKDCFLCTNLTQKQYCVLNKQLTKNEYEAYIKGLDLTSSKQIESLRAQFNQLCKEAVARSLNGLNNENVTGNYLSNCKNAIGCFDCQNIEEGMHIQSVVDAKDCLDLSYFGRNSELVYESHAVGLNTLSVYFSSHCWENIHNIYYSESCLKSHHLFGCVGVQHKSFCVLNKAYSETDYYKLVEKIVSDMQKRGEWGEPLPTSFSPFAYNETVANDYFPLTQSEANRLNWRWTDLPITLADESAKELDESNPFKEITKTTFKCIDTNRAYKLTNQEVEFYRMNLIPLPKKSPESRIVSRLTRRNPRILFSRECSKCHIPIQTSCRFDTAPKVFCEGCFTTEFY